MIVLRIESVDAEDRCCARVSKWQHPEIGDDETRFDERPHATLALGAHTEIALADDETITIGLASKKLPGLKPHRRIEEHAQALEKALDQAFPGHDPPMRRIARNQLRGLVRYFVEESKK